MWLKILQCPECPDEWRGMVGLTAFLDIATYAFYVGREQQANNTTEK